MRRLLFAFLSAALASVAWAERTPSVRVTDHRPALRIEANVGPGEALYSETLLRSETVTQTRTVAVLGADMVVTRDGIKFPAGTKLSMHRPPNKTEATFLPNSVPGILLFCSDAHLVANPANIALGGAFWKKFICLQDSKETKRFDRIVLRGYRKPDRIVSTPYEVISEPYDTFTTNSKVYRAELLYQGSGGGVLRLSYREYIDDMARPAFQQEATFDLNREGITELRFKGAEIQVFEATNNGIRYKVLSAFKW